MYILYKRWHASITLDDVFLYLEWHALYFNQFQKKLISEGTGYNTRKIKLKEKHQKKIYFKMKTNEFMSKRHVTLKTLLLNPIKFLIPTILKVKKIRNKLHFK